MYLLYVQIELYLDNGDGHDLSGIFFIKKMQVWIKKIYISPSKLKVRPNNLKK